MGWRLRKIAKLAPGVRLNLSKSGISLSIGGKGLSYNVGTKGTRATIGLPGSGVSYSAYEKHKGGWLKTLLTIIVIAALVWVVCTLVY